MLGPEQCRPQQRRAPMMTDRDDPHVQEQQRGPRTRSASRMKLWSSLWNADDWATRGGREKTDWSRAPFVASYRGFDVDGYEMRHPWGQPAEFRELDAAQHRKLRWVRERYTIYNYCTDRDRDV